MAATELMPMARPRWSSGKASVRMALELASKMAPPTPWATRIAISHSAPPTPVIHVTESRTEKSGEDGEAEVVHLHPAVHIAEATEAHDEHRRDEQVAHEQPQEIDRVRSQERVHLDALEDVRAAR